MAYNINNS